MQAKNIYEVNKMDDNMINKYERTTTFIIDKELWAWGAYRAKTLGYNSISEYLFDLMKADREKNLLKKEA